MVTPWSEPNPIHPTNRVWAGPCTATKPASGAGPNPSSALKSNCKLQSLAQEERFPRTPKHRYKLADCGINLSFGLNQGNESLLHCVDDLIRYHFHDLFPLSGFHLWIFQLRRRYSFQVWRAGEAVAVWSRRGWGRGLTGKVRRIRPAPTLPSDTQAFSPADRHPAQEEGQLSKLIKKKSYY